MPIDPPSPRSPYSPDLREVLRIETPAPPARSLSQPPATPVRGLVVAILVVGIAAFWWRGVVRGLDGGGDLTMIYSAVTVWLDGGDPYSFDETIEVFRRDGGDPERTKQPITFLSLYPPSTFAALAPIGRLRWNALQDLWTWMNVLLMLPLCWATVKLAGAARNGLLVWLIIGVCLLLGPVHTTFKTGQLTLLCMAPLLWGLVLSRSGRELAVGALLGYACALKPQLAGLFVLILPFLGRWRAFFAAGIVSAGLLGIGIARMELAGIDWLPALRANVELFTNGGTGDGRISNPVWHLRMDLPMLLHVFTDHRAPVQVITWLVVLAGMVVAAAAASGARSEDEPEEGRERELLAWSIVAVVTLLPLYHRFYDAVTLLIPFAWLVMRFQRRRLSGADGVVALMFMLFLLPNVTVAIHELLNPRLPDSLATFVGWRATVMTMDVWALLIMLAVLARRALARSTPPAPPRTATQA